LFSLYPLNRLTFELAFFWFRGHDPYLPQFEVEVTGQGEGEGLELGYG